MYLVIILLASLLTGLNHCARILCYMPALRRCRKHYKGNSK